MDLERLLLERELHLVLCCYARACDQRDWRAGSREILAPGTKDRG